MSTSNLIRWSGLSAVAAGVLLFVTAFFTAATTPPLVSVLASVTTVFALFGIYAVQVERSGIPGFAGFLLATTGFLVMVGDGKTIGGMPSWLLGTIMGALGLILLAIGTLTSGKFPRWVPWLWIAAVVIGLPSVFVPNLTTILGILGALASGLGLAYAGYFLWSRPT